MLNGENNNYIPRLLWELKRVCILSMMMMVLTQKISPQEKTLFHPPSPLPTLQIEACVWLCRRWLGRRHTGHCSFPYSFTDHSDILDTLVWGEGDQISNHVVNRPGIILNWHHSKKYLEMAHWTSRVARKKNQCACCKYKTWF